MSNVHSFEKQTYERSPPPQQETTDRNSGGSTDFSPVLKNVNKMYNGTKDL